MELSEPGGSNVYLWPGPAAKATSVAHLPEATPSPTSPTPASPRRQVAGNEGLAAAAAAAAARCCPAGLTRPFRCLLFAAPDFFFLFFFLPPKTPGCASSQKGEALGSPRTHSPVGDW